LEYAGSSSDGNEKHGYGDNNTVFELAAYRESGNCAPINYLSK
jgi:hypothetical protein